MDKTAELFAKLADQYGPFVIEAAKGAARVEAYSCLVSSLVAAGIAYAMYRAGQHLRNKKCEDRTDDGIVHAFGYLILALTIIPASIALWAWVDPWTWTTISQPELWIAKKTLRL